MMKVVIDKIYPYQEVEKKIYCYWLENHFFDSDFDGTGRKTGPHSKREKFVIVIPPPNVTGRLHMGHALNLTIQDSLIRYHRLRGKDVLWVPGTDHAGIATQTLVKKMLDQEGIDYRELGREKFIQRIWQWKEKYGDIILDQIKTLGASCDWSRTRFTMDDRLAKAVRHAFKHLYDEGLIYRGKRMVNWCPVDETALSDDEVETKPEGEPGFLYDIAYPIVSSDEKKKFLIVSTTRPETIFGDVAVAVHPDDHRYRSFIGAEVKLPLTDRLIPVIADDYVTPDFGTGCLKVTPAHDSNDYEIGQRHHLPMIDVMNQNATMNQEVPEPYQGLTREECRKRVIQDLENTSLLRRKQPRKIPLGRSYRSKAIIEYRLSEQWFVKTKPLAKKLLQMEGLSIYPSSLVKLWNRWLENINDWCISRQIWWGHQIPVWYHKKTGEILVEEQEQEPERVKKERDLWRQESDVLDTWFSSALWPMSVMGWPDRTPDFKSYFPTTTLSSGRDIIFFWVARMGLMSVHFEQKLPFKNVYFHPTVTDARGKTMSKSKGNGIDPQHVVNGATIKDLKEIVLEARPPNQTQLLAEIDRHFKNDLPGVGADALRFTLVYLSSNMQFLQIATKDFLEIGRRFITKFWNAARMVLGHLADLREGTSMVPSEIGLIESCWLEIKVNQAAGNIIRSYEEMDFSNLGSYYYNLIWNDFCDWYLETSKERMLERSGNQIKIDLICQFKKLLILLHPVIPFITEEIFQRMKELAIEKKLVEFIPSEAALIKENLTDFKTPSIQTRERADRFEVLQEVVMALRSFKKKNGLKDRDPLAVFYRLEKNFSEDFFKSEELLITRLARLKIFSPMKTSKSSSFSIVKSNYSLMIEIPSQLKKPTSEDPGAIEQIRKDLEFVTQRLANQGFIRHADPDLIVKERERQKKLQSALDRLLH